MYLEFGVLSTPNFIREFYSVPLKAFYSTLLKYPHFHGQELPNILSPLAAFDLAKQ
jgi:hypothetical protein